MFLQPNPITRLKRADATLLRGVEAVVLPRQARTSYNSPELENQRCHATDKDVKLSPVPMYSCDCFEGKYSSITHSEYIHTLDKY